MNKKILKIVILITITFITNMAFAQDDESGCQDPPFFTRMPNFYLNECNENYDEFELVVGNGQQQTLEGTVSSYTYYIKEDIEKLPSVFQILKNYENAILTKSGERIYLSSKPDDDGFQGGTFKMNHEGSIYWLTLDYFNGYSSACDGYTMNIIKVETMKQEVTANDMFQKISIGISLALYINFDTGKSSIKSDSQSLIDTLYEMLNDNPTLKISIEGHTDNVGEKEANQLLSEQRAASVKSALVNNGIDANRIKTLGYGQDKPIEDNSTETGKAKNRRVEIKKV